MPPNTKALAKNLTMGAYGGRQNATAFVRAHNSDLLRSLKHLMETRLRLQFFLTHLLSLDHPLIAYRQLAHQRTASTKLS